MEFACALQLFCFAKPGNEEKKSEKNRYLLDFVRGLMRLCGVCAKNVITWCYENFIWKIFSFIFILNRQY